MSNYTVTTNFLAKDALVSGNPAKLILGAQLTTEFNNIVTAITSKYDAATTAITLTGALNAGSAVITGATTIPLTIQELSTAPSNVTNAYIGVGTAALFAGGVSHDGDLVLIPRTSSNSSILLATGAVGAALVRVNVGAQGNVIIGPPSSGTALSLSGKNLNPALEIFASTTASQSIGARVLAGTNTSDYAVKVLDATGVTEFARIFGTGGMTLGAPTGGDQGLGALNAVKLLVNGTSVIQTGTFTGTLTGCTTSPTATFNYTITSGAQVILDCAIGLTGTSNTTACTVTGLPAALTPARAQATLAQIINASATGVGGATVSGTTISLGVIPGGTFTASGLKGLVNNWVCTYNLV